MMRKFLLFFLFSTLFILISSAQTQSPDAYLGYELGKRFTRHYQVVDYFKHVAANNSNVKLIQYGETYENRPLYIAIVSSEGNMSKLEEIQKSQMQASGMEDSGAKDPEVAIVWLSYNVHGNEAVSTEVAMKTLYQLVDPGHAQSKKWLENTVVIIDPCINPDGRERYVNWYGQKANQPHNTNPWAVEHREPWPGGRANHYLFDLNRDWAWATQKETQHRLEVYNNWLPHIHVDFHEQGVNEPYYFAPAAEPYHEAITEFQKEFQKTIGLNHARYFDKEGWLYFTKERFDLLYPSYGDTYPSFNGAIGMTYEQGGSGRAGLGVINEEGNELTLSDRIAHHYTTAMSTIEVASQNAARLIEEYGRYFDRSSKAQGKYRSYVIKNDQGDKLKSLTTLLDRHRIAYGSVSADLSTRGFSFKTNKEVKLQVEPSDLIINMAQPKANLVKALFEPQTKLSDSLTYDITAWSIPYARGLDAYALGNSISLEKYQEEISEMPVLEERPYAYISRWSSTDDVAFLSYLLKNKVKVRYAQRPFTTDAGNYQAGTLIITRAGNEMLENFDAIVRKGIKKFDRHSETVMTGWVNTGNDFGSSRVGFLKAPKVALLSGPGVSSLSFGAIWHFFEQQIAYPVNVLDTSYFNRVDLSEFDMLILPSGNYRSLLTESLMKELESWVRNGGKLLVIGSGISVFADNEQFDISRFGSEEEKLKAEELIKQKQKESQLRTYNDRERYNISDYITGSIFRASLDNTNPLGFGYDDYYYTLKVSESRYAYLENGYNVSVISDSDAKVSGFAGSNVIGALEESLVYGVERKGRGTVVYLVDDPLFRSFWENGKLLFSNAVFMVD